MNRIVTEDSMATRAINSAEAPDDVANAATGAVVLASGVADKHVERTPAFVSIGGEYMGTRTYGSIHSDFGDTLERFRSL